MNSLYLFVISSNRIYQRVEFNENPFPSNYEDSFINHLCSFSTRPVFVKDNPKN